MQLNHMVLYRWLPLVGMSRNGMYLKLNELKSQTNMGKLEWRMRTYSGDCSYEEKDQLGLDI